MPRTYDYERVTFSDRDVQRVFQIGEGGGTIALCPDVHSAQLVINGLKALQQQQMSALKLKEARADDVAELDRLFST